MFAKIKYPIKIITKPNPKLYSPLLILFFKLFSKNTFDNSECAKERAHNLKYEAVLETMPKMNSIEYIS